MSRIRIFSIASVLYFCSNTLIFSQEANYNGARNESLGRATVALTDSWALFYNPAGLVYNQTYVFTGYQSKYIELGINDGAFGFVFPIQQTALGIGASYFGDNILNKSKVIGSIAHKIGKTSLGIKSTYDQISIKELGSKGIFYFDIGGQINIGQQVTIGMALENINQAKFDTLSISQPNTLIKIGVNYHPHEKLTLLAQVEKDISNSTLLKLGMEYRIMKHVSVRTGIVPSPVSAFTGFGFNWTKIDLDFVGSYQQYLGWSAGFSFGIPINKTYEE